MSTLVPSMGLLFAAYLMRHYDLDIDSHRIILEQIHRREAGQVFEIVDPLGHHVPHVSK